MPSKICATLLLLTCALSGCVSLQKSSIETQKYAQDGISVNSVQLVGSEVLSFGRLAGEPEVEIEGTTVIHSPPSSQGATVTFLVPDSLFQEASYGLKGFLRNGAPALMSVITEVYAEFKGFDSSELNLDIVLAPRGSGAYYSSQGVIGESLPLSVVYFAPKAELSGSAGQGYAWWSALARTVSHELFHLHHDLSELSSEKLDEEVAASIIETCALVRYAREVDGTPTIDFEWILDDPRTSSSFPGLDSGRLNVELDRLEQLGGVSLQGQALATAVLYLLSPSGSIEVGKAESDRRILDYCGMLAKDVPEFRLGQW